jgi:hypothetical protein
MKTNILLAALGANVLAMVPLLMLYGAAKPRQISLDAPPALQESVRAGDFTISRPHKHGNLTIFLIHGKDKIKGKEILILEEALARKQAIVHETQSVNRLDVENTSKDSLLFIQSGDIVKGGQQDRLIAFDLLVPPQSGKVSVMAFCVEQNRWAQRGTEAVARFNSSSSQLPSKSLKLLAGSYGQIGGQSGQTGGQGGQLGQLGQLGSGFQAGFQFGMGGLQGGLQVGVWREVAGVQERLRKNTKAKDKGSSLQLTLENKEVQESVDKYVRALQPSLKDKKDVLGFAFAINGKFSTAEIYASADLFKKLWPKLLKASAAEALAEYQTGKKFPRVKAEDVKACFTDAAKGKRVTKDVTKRTRIVLQETSKNILLTTQDRQRKNTWIHKTYMTK